MTSIIKVNTIQDVGGNNLLISNGSGNELNSVAKWIMDGAYDVFGQIPLLILHKH